jgi:hypothetical protein
MDIASLRPILSGIVGGLLAIALCTAWARWVPRVCNYKRAETLLRQNRSAIWTVNALFFAGIGFALWLYGSEQMARTDWRGLGLGFGIGCASVFIVLPLFALAGGRNPKEAFVAYAIAQRTPVFVLYSLLVAGAFGLAASLASLLGT